MADQLPKAPDQFDRELDFGWMTRAMLVIVVVMIVAFFGIWQLSGLLKSHLAAGDEETSPLLAPGQTTQPPEPHLQVESYADWAEMKSAQDRELRSYSWVDKKEGRVRIPVQAAMEQIALHGLPSFEATGDGTLLTPEASN
jgi:hypothetical protein